LGGSTRVRSILGDDGTTDGIDSCRATSVFCGVGGLEAGSTLGITNSVGLSSSFFVGFGESREFRATSSGGITSVAPFKAAIAAGTDGKILNSRLKWEISKTWRTTWLGAANAREALRWATRFAVESITRRPALLNSSTSDNSIM
jgi:hypothetical protein